MSVNTKSSANANLRLAVGASFVVIGVVTVLLGQILPILASRFNLNDAEAGVFFFAQFSGSLIGTLLSGRLARRFGFRRVLILGFLLMIVGLPLLNLHEYVVCWLGIFLFGMGTGFSIPAGNLLTIETSEPEDQASAVNMINFCWGAGAIVCAPFVAWTSSDGSLVVVTAALVPMLILIAIIVLQIRTRSTTVTDQIQDGVAAIWRRPSSWLFALFSMLIIAIEAGLSGWLTTYSNLLRDEGALSLNAAFVYFASFVAGRAIASLAAKKITDNALLSINATLLIIGIVLLAIGSRETALPGAILAGLGTSAVFPTHMARFSRIFGPTASRNATPIFVFSILGAASVSWLIGVISTWSGSLRQGIALLLAAAASLAVLQIVIARLFKGETDFDTNPIKR